MIVYFNIVICDHSFRQERSCNLSFLTDPKKQMIKAVLEEISKKRFFLIIIVLALLLRSPSVCNIQIILMQKGIYCPEDGSSFTNSHHFLVEKYTVKLYPNLTAKTLKSQVIYHINVLQNTQQLVLDTMDLDTVKVTHKGTQLKHTIGQAQEIGSRLFVSLPEQWQKDSKHEISIQSTTSKAKSLTWGDYVFTQNQPIYCRSLFPCQDTPSCKSKFSTEIVLGEDAKDMKVFVSGIKDGNVFDMDIPIPSYLFAFLIGNFEKKKISDRMGIVAEPKEMEACVKELDQMEEYMGTLEKLLYPYQWGEYNICILPRAFPYGGMENPIYTFASPSIITGDKSGTSVAIHEMAHSWTGNLISCKNWENMWMNEGFTVYLEQNALKELNGQEFYQVNSIVSQKMLLKVVDTFGKDHAYSAMSPILNHAHPDDAYSRIPYDKGFIFLTYLEHQIGRPQFFELLNRFLKKFEKKSVDGEDFKKEFYAYIKEKDIKLKEEVDWDAWVFKPGYPVRMDLFKSKTINGIEELSALAESDPKKFDAQLAELIKQKKPLNILLVQVLLHLLQQKSLKHDTIQRLQTQFGFSQRLLNFELMLQWFTLCIKAKYLEAIPKADEKLLQKTGRMKFIRPLYRELYAQDKDLAKKLFEQNKHLYSAIAIDVIKKDLAK